MPTIAQAQKGDHKKENISSLEEENKSVILKFEPNYVSENEKRKTQISITRSIIDTLDISERKRLKLIRDLYKNGISKRLKKALLAPNNHKKTEE